MLTVECHCRVLPFQYGECKSYSKQQKIKINHERGQGRTDPTTHVSSLGKETLHYFHFIKYDFFCAGANVRTNEINHLYDINYSSIFISIF